MCNQKFLRQQSDARLAQSVERWPFKPKHAIKKSTKKTTLCIGFFVNKPPPLITPHLILFANSFRRGFKFVLWCFELELQLLRNGQKYKQTKNHTKKGMCVHFCVNFRQIYVAPLFKKFSAPRLQA
jgi:hypothetical protein